MVRKVHLAMVIALAFGLVLATGCSGTKQAMVAEGVGKVVLLPVVTAEAIGKGNVQGRDEAMAHNAKYKAGDPKEQNVDLQRGVRITAEVAKSPAGYFANLVGTAFNILTPWNNHDYRK